MSVKNFVQISHLPTVLFAFTCDGCVKAFKGERARGMHELLNVSKTIHGSVTTIMAYAYTFVTVESIANKPLKGKTRKVLMTLLSVFGHISLNNCPVLTNKGSFLKLRRSSIHKSAKFSCREPPDAANSRNFPVVKISCSTVYGHSFKMCEEAGRYTYHRCPGSLSSAACFSICSA